MRIRAGRNQVVVRRIGDPSIDIGAGVAVVDYVDEHLTRPCIGIVEDIGPMWYGGHELEKMGKRPKGRNMDMAQRINDLSLQYDVPCEVMIGDKVLFKFLPNIDEDASHGGIVIMRYDCLLARIEENDVLYPLNGIILVQVGDHEDSAGDVAITGYREPGWGTVFAQGCPVKHYLYYPESGGDRESDLVGKEIFFRNGMAVRIEHDAYRTLNLDLKYPLYYLHRIHVIGSRDGE